MTGKRETTVQVYVNQTVEKDDAPVLNRGAQGAGGQPPSNQFTWIGDNKVVVRSSGREGVRYYVIDGFRIYDDVILGKNVKVIETTGIQLMDYLDAYANEGSVVIIETRHGYEYCGMVHNGKQSRIYINHTGIDLQNIEITQCPSETEILKAMQLLEMHNLSIDSVIMNPWRSIVPYAIATLMKFGREVKLAW
jgi:hypothetical protein